MATFPETNSTVANATQSTISNATASGNQTADRAQDAIDRTARSAHDMVDRTAEKARPTVEHMRSSFNSASAALHSSVEEFDEYQQRWLASCRGHVRDYPLVSLGIAAAAGMVLSRLLSSR